MCFQEVEKGRIVNKWFKLFFYTPFKKDGSDYILSTVVRYIFHNFGPPLFIKNFTYFQKLFLFFEIMFRKSGFIQLVNSFKEVGKYYRRCQSFVPLHVYEDLKQVYLTCIKSI